MDLLFKYTSIEFTINTTRPCQFAQNKEENIIAYLQEHYESIYFKGYFINKIIQINRMSDIMCEQTNQDSIWYINVDCYIQYIYFECDQILPLCKIFNINDDIIAANLLVYIDGSLRTLNNIIISIQNKQLYSSLNIGQVITTVVKSFTFNQAGKIYALVMADVYKKQLPIKLITTSNISNVDIQQKIQHIKPIYNNYYDQFDKILLDSYFYRFPINDKDLKEVKNYDNTIYMYISSNLILDNSQINKYLQDSKDQSLIERINNNTITGINNDNILIIIYNIIHNYTFLLQQIIEHTKNDKKYVLDNNNIFKIYEKNI